MTYVLQFFKFCDDTSLLPLVTFCHCLYASWKGTFPPCYTSSPFHFQGFLGDRFKDKVYTLPLGEGTVFMGSSIAGLHH